MSTDIYPFVLSLIRLRCGISDARTKQPCCQKTSILLWSRPLWVSLGLALHVRLVIDGRLAFDSRLPHTPALSPSTAMRRRSAILLRDGFGKGVARNKNLLQDDAL